MFRRLSCLAIILGILLQSGLAETGTWKFGIMGDTHDAPPRLEGYGGVAVNYIKLANAEFIKHKVDFVVQCGDLADAQGGQDAKSYEIRFKAADDLRKAGIPFYALRGNHDISALRKRQMAEWFLPGVKGTEQPEGYIEQGLDYAFRHKNASLYFLDIDHSLNPARLVEWSDWVASNRNKTDRPPCCIVFTHRNLNVPLSFRESLFGPKNNSSPEQQNIFYKNLHDAGTQVVVTAHLHMHMRGTAKSPDGKVKLNTFICAPCGNKIFPINIPRAFWEQEQIEEFHTRCYGYYIVTVSETSLKFDFYQASFTGKEKTPPSSQFELKDSWTIPLAENSAKAE